MAQGTGDLVGTSLRVVKNTTIVYSDFNHDFLFPLLLLRGAPSVSLVRLGVTGRERNEEGVRVGVVKLLTAGLVGLLKKRRPLLTHHY